MAYLVQILVKLFHIWPWVSGNRGAFCKIKWGGNKKPEPWRSFYSDVILNLKIRFLSCHPPTYCSSEQPDSITSLWGAQRHRHMISALRLRPAPLSGYGVQGKQSASSPLHGVSASSKNKPMDKSRQTHKQFQYINTLATQEVVVCLTECPSALRLDRLLSLSQKKLMNSQCYLNNNKTFFLNLCLLLFLCRLVQLTSFMKKWEIRQAYKSA